MISGPFEGPERTRHIMQGLPYLALKSAIKFFLHAQACVLSAPTCIPD
jgi:hypothetical protein